MDVENMCVYHLDQKKSYGLVRQTGFSSLYEINVLNFSMLFEAKLRENFSASDFI